MARIVLTGPGWADLTAFDMSIFVGAAADDVTVTPRRIVIEGPAPAVFKGVGFGEPRANGFPGAGTIHSIFADFPEFDGAITGLDVQVEQMVALLDEGDVAGVTALFLAGDDWIEAGSGNSTLIGVAGADTLTGSPGDDALFGGDGADLLVGGLGQDRLAGGAGPDVYRFWTLGESASQPAADRIADLGKGDVIDLRPIDAKPGKPGDQAFKLVAELDGKPGQLALAYDAARDITWLGADADGDARPDLVVRIDGDHTDFTGFLL